MLPRAILLDLDDTIIDDTGGLDWGWAAACDEAALEAGTFEGAVLKSHVVEIRDWYWSDPGRHAGGRQDLRATSTWIVEQALERAGIAHPGLAARIANRYRDLREEGITLLPGAVEAIEGLRAAGVRLALLTNGNGVAQRAKIERFDLARHFDAIYVEGEFGRGKPDERVYRAALEALDTEPSHAWMVGDNLEWDVAAPMRLGVTGIWLDRFGAGVPSNPPCRPDRIITTLLELLEQ